MIETVLPVLDSDGRSARQSGDTLELKPRTWGSIAEAVRGNVAARRMMPLSYMELVLTSNCNLRCSYCFEKEKQPIDMPEETAYAAVDFLMEVSGPIKKLTILLFGGEPMLRFDLIKRVHKYGSEKAEGAGKRISWNMTTNGTLIDEQRAKWLAEHNVKYLLSMDGGREDHDRYRKSPNGQGTFDLLASRLPMFKRHQPWMGVKMSVTPESAPRLRRNIEELSRLAVNQFIYGYAHGMRWTDADLAAYEAGMIDVLELYLEMKYKKRHFRITTFEENNLCTKADPLPFGCGAGRGRLCVDPYGDMYGCSKMGTIMGPRNGVLPFGNVFQGFTRLENRYHCLNATLEPRRKCQRCEFRDDCGGGCPATNYADTGSVYLPDDVACKLVFVGRRVEDYARCRHDEVFGTKWAQSKTGGVAGTTRFSARTGVERTCDEARRVELAP